MPRVKLTPTLPGDDAYNGLAAIAAAVVDAPHDLRAIVLLVDCKEVRLATDIGERTALLRARRVEPILNPRDVDTLHKIVARAVGDRTGREPLPIFDNDDSPADED